MPSPTGLLRYVNLLQGTDSHHGFSTGNTLPLIAVPFGMNHWSPQTAEGRWFFSPQHRKLQGVRCTHQPSPWMGDYGNFVVMAQTGARSLTSDRRASAYRLDKSDLHPHRFAADLIRYRTRLEMSPTERGAIFLFGFPENELGRVILEPCSGVSGVTVRPDRHTIEGFTRGNAGGVPEGYAMYYVATFDRPIDSWCLFSKDDVYEAETEERERLGFAAEFRGGGEITMRIATSFISIEQAERNLHRELSESSMEDIALNAALTWEGALGRIQVETDDDTRRTTFYSCLYRTQLFPRIWHEPSETGEPRHRSPYSGQVVPGVLYTDNGFWDTYRTVYPLFALLQPDRLNEILQGWTNALKEGGWFPQWATPGYRACMVGTHIDAVMGDAVSRGVTGFDVESAFEGLLKHAYEVGDEHGAFGRIGIEDYKELGYVAHDRHHESVARTLDYAYDDFCIAQFATFLERHDDAAKLLARAKNYRHLYDPNVGFMRGRNADGSWLEPWSDFLWGSPYVEGGPWQSSWAVQHDPAGLIALMGGDDAFTEKLDAMLTTAPHFEVGVYGFEIHEMTEMAAADFGQYAHSNQPVHHALYLYNAAGRPWRTQREVRRVMDEMYTPDRFAGDEDNGEMAAWYVLSALGLFPLCPGHPSWTIGSPLFKRVTVSLPEGRELIVEAPQNSDENLYVRRLSFNGRAVKDLSLSHATIANGGTLRFDMGSEPDRTPIPPHRRPFSLSAYA
ncbi:MAG: GH92 family glycosyl hydrolase [Fimbriimonas sp.]